jgi:hypothetical protein
MKIKMKNNSIIIFIVIVIVILFFSIYFGCSHQCYNKREGLTSKSNQPSSKTIELVISRYNEDLQWMKNEPFDDYPNIIIYNKGPNENFYRKPTSSIVNVKNVGRCDHTYLYHIIQNYDKLKDITVFLPGSADMGFKIKQTTDLFNEIKKKNQAVFVNTRTFPETLREVYGDFQLDEWKASDERNVSINSESKLELSKYRPYGKWYDQYLKDNKAHTLSFYGIFSVAKEDIIQHPKSYYENLIQDLSNSSNPEVGHYFERSWVAIFHPLKKTVLIPE